METLRAEDEFELLVFHSSFLFFTDPESFCKPYFIFDQNISLFLNQ